MEIFKKTALVNNNQQIFLPKQYLEFIGINKQDTITIKAEAYKNGKRTITITKSGDN